MLVHLVAAGIRLESVELATEADVELPLGAPSLDDLGRPAELGSVGRLPSSEFSTASSACGGKFVGVLPASWLQLSVIWKRCKRRTAPVEAELGVL